MTPVFAEFVGTALVVLLGNGVVANVLLSKTHGQGSGLIVITVGWAMAVFVGILVAASSSGAHLNPAVTLALALTGKFSWSAVSGYILFQMLGGMMGAFLVWLVYRPHFSATADENLKLAVFCTAPAIRHPIGNVISEIVGTFVLVYCVLSLAKSQVGLGALDGLPVALLVMSIGVSLGGTTGYAINPARDFGPRLMHALLPIPGKRDSDWRYALVPIFGSLSGGVLAAVLYRWQNL